MHEGVGHTPRMNGFVRIACSSFLGVQVTDPFEYFEELATFGGAAVHTLSLHGASPQP
jgi:hypothetical protein